jgi:Uma2 family endonuclease
MKDRDEGYPVAMSMLVKPPKLSRMRTTEFLLWPDDPTGQRWQLVDGEPVAIAPASDAHGTVQAAFSALLFVRLRDRRSRCRVVSEPGIAPNVRSESNVRIRDLAVTCAPPDPNAPGVRSGAGH